MFLLSDIARRSTSALLVTLDSSQAGSLCNFVLSLSRAAFASEIVIAFRCKNRLVNHVVVRHGNVTSTSVRDVVLMSLFSTLCSSNSWRFNDYVLMMLL